MTELRQHRANAMKDKVFKSYRYNFILSGVVERQMVELKICQTTNLQKLDWISQHKGVKISYQLPKNDKGEVK